MEKMVEPGSRHGQVNIPSSKSYVHRQLIACALAGMAGNRAEVAWTGMPDDIMATKECVERLADAVVHSGVGAGSGPREAVVLNCRESGSTLRFLIPLAGVLGIDAEFRMAGRLGQRPLGGLIDELARHGMRFRRGADADAARGGDGSLSDDVGTRAAASSLFCSGRLKSGDFRIPGNISSQYITGILMALPILDGDSTLTIEGPLESAGYIDITEDVLKQFGIKFEKSADGRTYRVPGGQAYSLGAASEFGGGLEGGCAEGEWQNPELSKTACVMAEGDWSSAAFFLCLGAMSEAGIEVSGLDPASAQGDAAILDILREMGAEIEIRPGAKGGHSSSCEESGTIFDDGFPLCAEKRKGKLQAQECAQIAGAENPGSHRLAEACASTDGEKIKKHLAEACATADEKNIKKHRFCLIKNEKKTNNILDDLCESKIFIRKGILRSIDIDVSQIPDMVPALAALAMCAEGESCFRNAARLRAKESDRLVATVAMVCALGGEAAVDGDTLTVRGAGGRPLAGGRVDGAGDHRIVMAAAVAATACSNASIIDDAECVSKSYPDFWEDFETLQILSRDRE